MIIIYGRKSGDGINVACYERQISRSCVRLMNLKSGRQLNMFLQRTLKQEITCRSIGLHSGRKVGMVIRPAAADEGDAPERPSMAGSARPFVNLFREVGTQVQGKGRKLLVIKKEISVSDGEGMAMFLPSPDFRITYKIEFGHPFIGVQQYHLKFSDVSYKEEICSARTFGFLKDVEYLQAKGLALGGPLKNAIILDDHRIINKEGLRCPDEFVKHKILDAIGDLSLLGIPIIGHFVAYKSGHRLNNPLLKELMVRRECWTMVSRFSKDMFDEIASLRIPSFGVLDSVQVIPPVV